MGTGRGLRRPGARGCAARGPAPAPGQHARWRTRHRYGRADTVAGPIGVAAESAIPAGAGARPVTITRSRPGTIARCRRRRRQGTSHRQAGDRSGNGRLRLDSFDDHSPTTHRIIRDGRLDVIRDLFDDGHQSGDTELRGPGTIELTEDNGMFRVTGVTATPR